LGGGVKTRNTGNEIPLAATLDAIRKACL
jgi:polysaccharide pyruvyl transferase WcaK-like protein